MAAKETSIIDGDVKESKTRIKNPGKILLSLEVSQEEAFRIIGQLSGQIGLNYVGGEGQEQYQKHFATQKEGST